MADSGSSTLGIVFPLGGDGRRSTSATGRAVFADSVRRVDPALAATIEHTADWRSGYLGPLRDVVRVSASSADAAVAIASDGLASAGRRFAFTRDGQQVPLPEAMSAYRDAGLASVVVRGSADGPDGLLVPYRGRLLGGDDLRRQADHWVTAGVAEPGLLDVVDALVANPGWFDLRDLDVVVLGAAAEMGPTQSLLRWGANVHAIDLPRPDLWRRLISWARATAGTLRVPVPLGPDGRPPFVIGGIVHPDDDDRIAGSAGVDLVASTPEVATWVDEIGGPLVLGSYAYADGATHVLLSMAADTVAETLLRRRSDVTLAYLATPTDVFAVPEAAVQESRRRWDSRGLNALLQAPLRLVGQFEPNYPATFVDDVGREFGLCDALVSQQGPNYALAKRLQRWRASTALAADVPVSINLAPATRTRSVIRNRALAAAYAGAGRFGVEVFEPQTSAALMSALLVFDLRTQAVSATAKASVDPGPSNPGPSNPMDRYRLRAVHGGLWRTAYAPRSVLGIAAMLGMVEARP